MHILFIQQCCIAKFNLENYRKPDVTSKSDVTSQSDVTSKPDVTSQSDVTSKPDVTTKQDVKKKEIKVILQRSFASCLIAQKLLIKVMFDQFCHIQGHNWTQTSPQDQPNNGYTTIWGQGRSRVQPQPTSIQGPTWGQTETTFMQAAREAYPDSHDSGKYTEYLSYLIALQGQKRNNNGSQDIHSFMPH